MNADKLKSSKLFYLSDIFVYALLSLVIFALFLVFIILPAKDLSSDSPMGFTVSKNGKEVIVYTFTDGILKVDEGINDLVQTSESEKEIIITVYQSLDKSNYNKLKIDKTKKTISVFESTCHSKTCTLLGEIGDSGTIYCSPHNLKITSIGNSGFIPPVAG